jgi:hypothetical protein
MTNDAATLRHASERPLPERILIADIAHPDRDECELEIVSDDHDWGGLPTALYLRADDAAGGTK